MNGIHLLYGTILPPEAESLSSQPITPFLYILAKGTIDDVKSLIDQGLGDTFIVTDRGMTALHVATYNTRNPKVLQYFMDRDLSSIEAKNNEGDTPLMCAIPKENYDAVGKLLENGARIDCVNDAGKTPLSLALQWVLIAQDAWIQNYNRFLKICLKLIGHRVLLEHREGVTFPLEERRLMDRVVDLTRHYDSCQYELNSMKEMKLHENISLYDLVVVANDGELDRYYRNYEIVRALRKVKSTSYKIYAPSAKRRMESAIRLRKSTNAVAMFLSEIFSLNGPKHLVVERIVGYLSRDEVERLSCLLLAPTKRF